MTFQNEDFRDKQPDFPDGSLIYRCDLRQSKKTEIGIGKTGLRFVECKLFNCTLPSDASCVECDYDSPFFISMEQAIKDNVRVMIPYLTILDVADDCLKEAASCTLEGEERTSYLTSCRNRALAHASGTPEAAFIGNLTEEPTTTQAELEARGIKAEEAAMLIASRDSIRSAALGLI